MKPNPKILRGTLIAILLSTTVTLLVLSAFAEVFTEGKQVPPATENLKTGAETTTQPEKFEALGTDALKKAQDTFARLTKETGPKKAFNL